MKGYIQLLRPKHGVKNLLVLFPLVFSGRLWEGELLARSLWAALAFWGAAGAVYIFNDVRDRERDRLHPTKCRRPIASGAVSVPRAAAEGAVLIALTAGIFPLGRLPAESGGCLVLYILLNLGYSLGLKDVPILDLAILVSGFLLRVLFGAAVTGISVSGWLYLTVTALSFYLGLSKRRGELRTARGGGRLVLRFYSDAFLSQNMQMCLTLAVVFYALWTVDRDLALVWTVPLMLCLCLKYSLVVEESSDGDPVEVLYQDRGLLLSGAAFAALTLALLYLR